MDQRHATIETNRAAALASASGVELRQPHTPGSAADVFESLLAAEQGHAPPPVLAPAPADLSPAVLDDLASRVAERLRPAAERMGTDLRGALAEAVQAAVSGTIPGGVRDAVNESVAAAIRDAVVPVVRDSVRDAVETAVRGALPEALARVVPGAVIDAVGGDGGGDVRALVRETAERLITEEIARIRQPRG